MKIKIFSLGSSSLNIINNLKNNNLSKIILYNTGYPGTISEKTINLFIGSKNTSNPNPNLLTKTNSQIYKYYNKETKESLKSLKHSLFNDFINIFVLDPQISNYSILNNILDNKKHEYLDIEKDSVNVLVTSKPLSIKKESKYLNKLLDKIKEIPSRKTFEKIELFDPTKSDDPEYLDSLLNDFDKNYDSDYKKLSLIVVFDFEKIFLENKNYTDKEKKANLIKNIFKPQKTIYFYKDKFGDIIESLKPIKTKNKNQIINEDDYYKTDIIISNFIDNLAKLKNLKNFKKFIEKARTKEKTHVLVLNSITKVNQMNKMIGKF